MPSLEDELNALLAGSANIAEGVSDAKKQAGKVRRKSKDLEATMEELATMGEATAESFGSLKSLASGMGYEEVFKKIDLDGNGTLEPGEILEALNEAAGEDAVKKDLLEVKKMVCEVKPGMSGKSDEEIKALTDEELSIDLDVFTQLMKAVDKTEEGMPETKKSSKNNSRRASKEIMQ